MCVGGGGPDPCPPSGSAHGTGLGLHLLRYTENPFYRAHRLLYDTLRSRERCMFFLNFVIFLTQRNRLRILKIRVYICKKI